MGEVYVQVQGDAGSLPSFPADENSVSPELPVDRQDGTNRHLPSITIYFFKFSLVAMLTIQILSASASRPRKRLRLR